VWEQAYFWGCTGFCPNFPKLAQNVLVQLVPTVFGMTSKNGLHLYFCKRRAPFCEVQHRWIPFLPRFSGILHRRLGILFRFSGILPRFQQIKTLGGALAPHTPPPPTPLLTALCCVYCVVSTKPSQRLQTGLRLRDRNAIIFYSVCKYRSEWERLSCRKLPMDQYANCGTIVTKLCNFTKHEKSEKHQCSSTMPSKI